MPIKLLLIPPIAKALRPLARRGYAKRRVQIASFLAEVFISIDERRTPSDATDVLTADAALEKALSVCDYIAEHVGIWDADYTE